MPQKRFPSPCRGLIFLTIYSTDLKIYPYLVSVPLQGTYLPYDLFPDTMQEYDCVSVPLQGTYLPYATERMMAGMDIVSVPLQGTYLPYNSIYMNGAVFMVSVPLQGTYLPYTAHDMMSFSDYAFPSPCRGLIFLTIRIHQIIESDFLFPSPCRGLIFLTKLQNLFKLSSSFRPLAGDLSSLHGCTKSEAINYLKFPSPCRGLIFLTHIIN